MDNIEGCVCLYLCVSWEERDFNFSHSQYSVHQPKFREVSWRPSKSGSTFCYCLIKSNSFFFYFSDLQTGLVDWRPKCGDTPAQTSLIKSAPVVRTLCDHYFLFHCRKYYLFPSSISGCVHSFTPSVRPPPTTAIHTT